MTNEQIIAKPANDGLKNFIIGKLWILSQDGSRPGSIQISRNLPKDIVLTKGTTLFFNTNEKRADKQDADYSVSVRLPIAIADELIALERAAVAARKATAAQVA